ncbi:MAG: TlpA family protein disulfide reductase [Bacteroidetes bacterium]|nr:TlpA family protein disulfide reductase [Bacteroidota bacterium]
MLQTQIKGRENSSIGNNAYAFSAKDVNGNIVSLTKYRGQYVLLDFWASWCVPCRKGNPHLRYLYSKYKSDGIEFIGISSDDRTKTLKEWRSAIAADSITRWLNILSTDLGSKLDISKKYSVSYLPTQIIIDPSGVIIGRFSSDDYRDLDQKLETLFKGK